MKEYRRIVLEEAILGVGFLIASWYLYYLVGIQSMSGHIVDGPFKEYVTGAGIHVEMIVSGLGLGVLLALVNNFSEGTKLRRLPFGWIILIKSGIYIGGLAILGGIVNLIFILFLFSPEEMNALWFIIDWALILGLGLWISVSIIGVNFLLEVRRKVGPGNLWALLSGRYHRPREEDRVFLFIDLKSSTAITESLGHSRYSQFLRQCYHDLTEFVLRFGGQIYQYVGDEVVLSWSSDNPRAGRLPLDTFFGFCQRLEEKRTWYEETYGFCPEFRGGVDGGVVTVTEVGDIKRDIAFHGDPLNTAARLLGLSRDYGLPILVSERIHQAIGGELDLTTLPKGEVPLRGKAAPVAVFGVEWAGVQ